MVVSSWLNSIGEGKGRVLVLKKSIRELITN